MSLAVAPVAVAQTAADVDTTTTVAMADGTLAAAPRVSWFSRVARDMSVGFFNFASTPVEQANVQAGRIEAYSYFNFDYRLDRNRKFSLRPVFQWGLAGTDYKNEYREGDIKLGDAYLVYAHNDLASLAGEIKMNAQMRVYAPTSKSSSDSGMITRLRPLISFERVFSRSFDIVFTVEPDYYLQSRTGSLDDRDRVRGNRNYGYESGIDFNYHFNRTFGATVGVGHDEAWSHVVPIEGVHEIYKTETMVLDASVNMGLKGVFMVAGISQKRDIARPRTGFRAFHENESSYYLLSSLRF